MKYVGGVLLLLGILLGTFAATAAEDDQASSEIMRGRYLATVGDCSACHTASGGKAYAGGRSIETPFGTIITPNLTSDRETGIGAWSDDDFVNAIQQGRGHGGIRLYPAMPYTYFTKVSRTDLLAIRAFLDTLPPVGNKVVTNQLPFPFNIRASMAVWNKLFFDAGPFKPVAGKSDEWNAGAYLVEGLGHCGACHTSKNLLGGDKTSQALQGGALQGWFAPNLTGDPRTGLGSWSAEDIVAYLKTGHNRVTAATGPMSDVIKDSTSQMTDVDLKAIAAYLKGEPIQDDKSPKPISAGDSTMRAGEAVYVDNCAACHTAAGTGILHLFPTLKGSPSVQSTDPTSLIRIVLQGTQSVSTKDAPTAPSMPAFGWKLSDDEVAAVITYIRNSWSNASSATSASDVKSTRQRLSEETP